MTHSRRVRCARRPASAALGDAQEGLPAALVALAAALLFGALLGVAPALLRAPRALAQVGGVEVLGPDRLLDEHEDVLARDLDVALALGEALDLRLGPVEAKLRRLEQAEQWLVVGQHADGAHRRAGRDHLDLVVEHLALGGQHLDADLRAGHASAAPSPCWPPRRPGRSSPS